MERPRQVLKVLRDSFSLFIGFVNKEIAPVSFNLEILQTDVNPLHCKLCSKVSSVPHTV